MSSGFVPNVPRGWSSIPLKYACALNPEVLPESTIPDTELEYVDITALEEGNANFSPRHLTFREAPSRARRVLRSGDTIISTVRTYLRAVAHFAQATPGLVASTGFAVLRPNGMMTPRFAYWAALSEPVIQSVVANSQGVSYPAINPSTLGTLPIPVPPLSEQVRIANFLDEKTARIDALIAEKEQLVATLREHEYSYVSELMTRGIGTRVHTRDARSQEAGAIPNHWRLERLKFLAEVRSGITKGKEIRSARTVSRPYLRVANVQDGYLDLTEVDEIEVSSSDAQRYLLQKGDVLMNEGGDNDKLGRGTVWMGQITRCLHQNHVFAVRLANLDLVEWVAKFTSTAAARAYFFLRSKQSTNLASINQADVRELPVPMPPARERVAILAAIDRTTAATREVVAQAQAHITRLREYRASLITAAVSGGLEVSAYSEAA